LEVDLDGWVMESQRSSDNELKGRIITFTIFIISIVLIFLITSFNGLFLMAPPYGVTAYLATFARKNEFSKPVNFVMSYIFVIATTEILHSVLGFSIIVVLTNVIMVSAFISFTRFVVLNN
jgi:hypothetical protein